MRINELFDSALRDAQSGQFATAAKTLRSLLDEPLDDQNRGTVQGLLGVVHASLGDYDSAVVNLRAAAACKPGDAAIASNLCNCLVEAGHIDDAIAAGEKATTLNPAFAEAHNNLGNAFNAAGLLDKAIAGYRQALILRPDFAEAHNNLGNALYAGGDLDNAIISYQGALDVFPDFADAHKNLGNVHFANGAFDAAAASYRRALEIEPDNAEFHNSLGLVFERKGEPGSAIPCFQQALKCYPGLAEAHINLGNAYSAMNETENAVASYRAAQAMLPDNAAAHAKIAAGFKKLGRFEDALHSSDLLDTPNARADSLLCLSTLGRYEAFYQRVRENHEPDRTNLKVAAICAFVSSRTGQEDPHPFCPQPLEFVKVGHLRDHVEDVDPFMANLAADLRLVPAVWDPLSRTTHHGFQTHGNLFARPEKNIALLEQVIKSEIEAYFARFKTANCLLVDMWPKEHRLTGWSVRLQKGGYQSPHIHPAGWLSGVIYLELVDSDNRNEGAIEFGLRGEDFPAAIEDDPVLLHYPEKGEIVLFPSSLYHRTIPIRNEGERLIVSFDLSPA